MGKRQHQKDKMYLTTTEWSTLYGGKQAGVISKEEEQFKRLPLDHCCLSLQKWIMPYCDRDGNMFDLHALLPFVKQFKINPVTGAPLDAKTLIELHFYRNANGEMECPVLFRPFTNSSHIVAIATTGNVYLMEAVEQLNIKTKNWKDLLTDEPFERRDIISLQDPKNVTKFNITRFHHVVHNVRVTEQVSDEQVRLRNINPETKYTMEELDRDYKQPTEMHKVINKVTDKKQARDRFNAAHFSTGAVAAGLTSTVMDTTLIHEAAIRNEDEVRYERVKKKGYVRVVTNLGPLNFELYCAEVPKACENFLKHCKSGYYDGTKFHRSIRNFIVQGGDPTGTGTGGESIWGKPFEDEFRSNFTHTGRGVLSMANSGKHTNGSQFFITYRTCKQLDNKHTIFGRLVGGIDTLTEMEKIEVDNKDRPIYDIVLVKCSIFVDPFEEADEQLAKERMEEIQKAAEEKAEINKTVRVEQKTRKVFKTTGIGKYINPQATKNSRDGEYTASTTKKRKTTGTFNFDNW